MKDLKYVLFLVLIEGVFILGMGIGSNIQHRVIRTTEGPKDVDADLWHHSVTVSHIGSITEIHQTSKGLIATTRIPWRWGAMVQDWAADPIETQIYNAVFSTNCD